jgi:hypothetical protein
MGSVGHDVRPNRDKRDDRHPGRAAKVHMLVGSPASDREGKWRSGVPSCLLAREGGTTDECADQRLRPSLTPLYARSRVERRRWLRSAYRSRSPSRRCKTVSRPRFPGSILTRTFPLSECPLQLGVSDSLGPVIATSRETRTARISRSQLPQGSRQTA